MLGDTDDVYGVYDQCVHCLSGVQRLKNMLGDTDNVSTTSVSVVSRFRNMLGDTDGVSTISALDVLDVPEVEECVGWRKMSDIKDQSVGRVSRRC